MLEPNGKHLSMKYITFPVTGSSAFNTKYLRSAGKIGNPQKADFRSVFNMYNLFTPKFFGDKVHLLLHHPNHCNVLNIVLLGSSC